MSRLIEIYEEQLPAKMRKGDGEGNDLSFRGLGGREFSIMGVKAGVIGIEERIGTTFINSREEVIAILENIAWDL